MISLFSHGLVLSRRGKAGRRTVYIVAEYDNTEPTPRAELVPFPDPASRNTRPEPWKVTLPEVNSLLDSGELSIGY